MPSATSASIWTIPGSPPGSVESYRPDWNGTSGRDSEDDEPERLILDQLELFVRWELSPRNATGAGLGYWLLLRIVSNAAMSSASEKSEMS